MKKLIALLLAAVLVLSLAACGQNNDPAETNGSESTTAPTDPAEKGPLYTKDSYTVSDEDARSAMDTVVATVGDGTLTSSQLQVYYWMDVFNFLSNYGSYAAYFGLDYTLPLDEQDCAENDGTWQHYFLNSALNTWHSYQAMALMAKDAELEMEEDLRTELENLEKTLSEAAAENDFDSVEALIQADMGPGSSFEAFRTYREVYYWSYTYFNHMYEQLEVTDAMIEEYFTEHESELEAEGITKDSGDVVGVRHILIEIEGGTKDEDGNVTYSDDEWEACRVKAQDLLDEWLAGDATEETFAEFANEHSADGGSNTNGGLYEGLNDETNFVPEFKDWYLDESRQVGDYGLVKTDYGYHIMYYSSAEAEWISHCRNALLEELGSEIMTEAIEKYPMTVNYENIVLGEVELATSE